MRHNILARTKFFDASEKEVSSSGRNNFNNTKPLTLRRGDKLLRDKSTYFYKQQWFRPTYSIPILCSTALLMGLGMAIFPVVGSSSDGNVYAEEDYGIDTQAYDANTVSLEITSNTDSNGSTDITDSTQVAYREYGFKAIVGNTSGYKVYVQAANGYTGSLKGLANPREEVTGVGTNVAVSNFQAGTWGYAVDLSSKTNGSLLYSTVPENGTSIQPAYTRKGSATGSGGDSLKVVFAALIGDKPADHYQTKVLLSLATGANEMAGLASIDTMQKMTPTVCANTPEHYTKQLTDVRDGKRYWVAKLKDGNCWMTQNLDWDLPVGTGVTIEAANTDLTTNQVGLTITRYSADGATGWGSDNDALKFYNPGLWVYITPMEENLCTDVLTLNSCVGYGWKEYYGGDPEQEHYLIGNYYSWKAAILNTTITNNNAEGSICPKGWKLPINNNPGSFYFLFKSYGLVPDGVASSGPGTVTGTVDGREYNVFAAPLYFLRGGQINSTGKIIGAGFSGLFWYGVTDSAADAYYTNIYSSGIDLFPSSARYRGLFVRCVAK